MSNVTPICAGMADTVIPADEVRAYDIFVAQSLELRTIQLKISQNTLTAREKQMQKLCEDILELSDDPTLAGKARDNLRILAEKR